MAAFGQKAKTRGFEPLVQRLLAIDAGSRAIRFVLLERRFGRLRILRQNSLDLSGADTSRGPEISGRLKAVIAECGHPAVALALPQEAIASQLIDIPADKQDQAPALIHEQIMKMRGVEESRMVYDFAPIASETARPQFWVTFCREEEIQSRIRQLDLSGQDIRDITSTANALIAAWRAVRPEASNAVLVHAGAQSTVLVVIRQGSGVFASSFPMGGDFLTRAIVRLKGVTFEAAELLKCNTNLLQGPQALPGFADAIDGWALELKQQLREWQRQFRGTAGELSEYELVAIGAPFKQPGLLSLLSARSALKFNAWPQSAATGALKPEPGFETALGTGLQALGESSQPISLLPENWEKAWKRSLRRQQLTFVNTVLAGVCTLVLALGLWSKYGFLREREELLRKVESGIATVQTNAVLKQEWQSSFDLIRPLFALQQSTTDTLQSLAMLQQVRSNQALWFVLIADQRTYFAASIPSAATNQPGPPVDTNGAPTAASSFALEPSPAQPGLIAELCIPDGEDEGRKILSQLVSQLKAQPLFSRVDMLPSDLRRSLANPKVVLPQRSYPLFLDFARTEFEPASEPKPGAPGSAIGPPTRTRKPEPRTPATPM